MGAPLYRLASDYRALLDAAESVDPETGEVVTSDLAAPLLEALAGTIEQKIEGVLGVVAELDHRADALRAEEKRLAERRRAAEAHVARLREYVARSMEETGMTTMDAGSWRVTVVKGRESVACEDFDKVPSEFRRVKEEPDIAAAKELLKTTGMLPAGFTVKQGKPSLRVK